MFGNIKRWGCSQRRGEGAHAITVLRTFKVIASTRVDSRHCVGIWAREWSKGWSCDREVKELGGFV